MTTVALIGADGAGKTSVAGRSVDPPAGPGALPVHGRQRRLEQRDAADHPARPPGQTGRSARARTPPVRRPTRRARHGRRSFVKRRVADVRAALRSGTDSPRSGIGSGWPGAGSDRGAVVLFDRHFFVDYHAYDVDGEDRSWSQRLHGSSLGGSTRAPTSSSTWMRRVRCCSRARARARSRPSSGVATIPGDRRRSSATSSRSTPRSRWTTVTEQVAGAIVKRLPASARRPATR